MLKNKYTAGKWEITPTKAEIKELSNDKPASYIIDSSLNPTIKELRANANLIETAPDMHILLKECQVRLIKSNNVGDNMDLIKRIDVILDKIKYGEE